MSIKRFKKHVVLSESHGRDANSDADSDEQQGSSFRGNDQF